MRVRMMRSHLWVASVLVGLGVMTVSCGASTSAIGGTLSTSTPLLTPTPVPSPTATISPTATATIAGCSAPDIITRWENPPGPLPTTIPLPPGTLVGSFGMASQGGNENYNLCTPGATPAGITAFMDSALPAAGWMRHGVPICIGASYDWYKGIYGMDIFVDVDPSRPAVWALMICADVGQY
jgi:hypothetical protein